MPQSQQPWNFKSAAQPIVAHVAALAIAFNTLSRTTRHPRITFLLIAVLTFFSSLRSRDISPDDSLNAFLVHYFFLWLAHQGYLHVIVRTQALVQEREKYIANHTGKHSHYVFAYKLLWNPRLIGTSWEVNRKKVADGEQDGSEKTNEKRRTAVGIRARVSFVAKRFLVLALRFLAISIFYDPDVQSYVLGGKPIRAEDFSTTNQQSIQWLGCLFGICTSPEVSRATLIRLHSVANKVIPGYLMLASYHELLSIVAVGTGLDAPEEWPSLYGSLASAFTVRNFWSKHGHALVYRSFSAYAGYCADLLGVRKGMRRYFIGTFIFLETGLLHTLMSWIKYPKVCQMCGCWGETWWYTMQFGALLAEGAVQHWLGVLEQKVLPWSRYGMMQKGLRRLFGYVWVFSWLAWSLQLTEVPFQYCLAAL